MLDFLRRLWTQVTTLWGRWSVTQRIILGGVAGAAIVAIIVLVSVSGTPSMVALLGTPVTEPDQLAQIGAVLDEEGVSWEVRGDERVYVADQATARRIRAILVREDLIPPQTDPWSLFDVDRFSITDFERNVNLRRAITRNLEQHIVALDDIDAASVTLVVPERELFTEDQDPTTASIVITPRPGSDILENRGKVEGVQRLVQFAVAGLQEEHIVILDHRGLQINDFQGLEELDRVALAERQIKTKFTFEQQYKREILQALGNIFTADRVEILKLDIDLDLSRETTQTEEHFPITLREDNPLTPFDETEVVESVTISREAQEESFRGTGFNPEGPPGQEGQTPPAYRDLSNLQGLYDSSSLIQNEAVNRRTTASEKSPWNINRISVGVALDGVWRRVFAAGGQLELEEDGSIQRQYDPVSDEDLRKAESLIADAIGLDARRGDSVTVEHLQFDRTAQFAEEDEIFRRQLALRRTLISIILAVVAIFVAAVLYRIVSPQIERRRRLREEELARQHQAMREAALRSAEESGPEAELTIEDRAKQEMQDNAIALAREHPEDVAQLLRTWLIEE